MSWMAQLYETYEQAMNIESMGSNYPMPVSHTIQNAHVVISIDIEGNFKRAEVLNKTQIVLPATEKSAGRSSGEAPHALADKIQYVAGDYEEYGGLKSAYFDGYQRQLLKWIESGHSNSSIEAVYRYISKKSVVKDLVREKILWAENNILLTSWEHKTASAPEIFKALPKEKGKLDQGSALVCWAIESDDIKYAKTWKDPTIQQQWITYESKNTSNQAICYISGHEEPVALNHPAKLRHSGDKAKLISANDLSGFTFKGRFTDSKTSIESHGLQAASIGFLTTQKAHNALRWLINRKESTLKNGDQIIVAWAISGKDLPSAFGEPIPDLDIWDFSPVANKQDDETEYVSDLTTDLGAHYARKLKSYMQGYHRNLETKDTVSIMAIDSATPGRMAVTYYRKTMPKDYLDDISAWHIDFAWPQRVVKEVISAKGKSSRPVSWPVQAPSPYSIMQAIYGDVLKSNESLKKQFYNRLLPCLVDKACIPQDMLRISFQQACKSTNKDYWEWERNLGVACALYKGFYARHLDKLHRKEISMSLDTSITSRDYLYGRLLAVSENIESYALYKSEIKRPTSANRLMQRFADRPYTTWLTIYKQLDPYIQQLSARYPNFLNSKQQILGQIMDAFQYDDFKSNKALEGEFLLGFHCQRLAFQAKKETNLNEQGE
ncbi:type I-C CRISPR-associated protein Cas8c/Csd1 [Paraglaciecola aquimarina]|uniref:Type I-C CRISPR-associated protein Cas8c/Csd1 n=1 Tax=Paraglaciecola aquimarina TaxID=1235557 RepID=A0ABU3T0M3_9ALTE|nr:type I-C CRISPR-associated protein Cas8c/Csd1 [Paraglaciecola aquimarina]MDU0355809.1 type I-C CRISPR-associated protein Cas8c/Csd1 [Paraglaciecola aquimarina]